jgi:hypoxanthine phosphoribosyltransferase
MPLVRGRSIRVLYDAPTIAVRNAEMAMEIAAAGYEDLLVVSILKGSFVFAADLIRSLHDAGMSPEVEFITLSSYRTGTVSAGEVTVLRDIETDVAGRDVLLVDDILESGRTLAYARGLMEERGARRVGIAVLLDKPGKLAQPLEADHVGFICPDLFVVGYGMDVAHAFRELPFVGVVED